MFKELLSVFGSHNPLSEMASEFTEMLRIACGQVLRAGEHCFGAAPTPEERAELYRRDVKVNKLERTIRKRVIAHLSLSGNNHDIPYCLLLMSLVKDAERIGDYAKNLAEVREIQKKSFPDDDIVTELRELRSGVEAAFKVTDDVFTNSDRDEASALIRAGRDLARRSDLMLLRIAESSHDARTTTALVLTTRYYKRIGGHLLNIFSSVVMPLHKLDYYDERELEAAAGEE
jgi:phosphate transport system protein